MHQKDDGVIVLMNATDHRAVNHPDLVSEIDRPAFRKWKEGFMEWLSKQ
jgi:hypothetical protein